MLWVAAAFRSGIGGLGRALFSFKLTFIESFLAGGFKKKNALGTASDGRAMGHIASRDALSGQLSTFWVVHVIVAMGRAHQCDSNSWATASVFPFLAISGGRNC